MERRGAVIDVDGTLVRGDDAIPGAAAAVTALRDAGLDLAFVTNNPTRSPAAVAAHLDALGFDVSPEEVVTAGGITRAYLRRKHPDAAVFVVGESGLRDQLDGVSLTDDPRAADVLLGSISRAFDYADLTDALRALSTGDTAFVGTDPDRTIPGREELLPGSGAILGAIEATTGREPTVVGKPSAHAAQATTDRLGLDPAACLLVGDRLDTDVRMGAEAGMETALVLSGVTDRTDAESATPAPDHVVSSLSALPETLGLSGRSRS
ncbi:MAG: HAD-IIA family hydrolase [Halobacteriaceae archaeon]